MEVALPRAPVRGPFKGYQRQSLRVGGSVNRRVGRVGGAGFSVKYWICGPGAPQYDALNTPSRPFWAFGWPKGVHKQKSRASRPRFHESRARVRAVLHPYLRPPKIVHVPTFYGRAQQTRDEPVGVGPRYDTWGVEAGQAGGVVALHHPQHTPEWEATKRPRRVCHLVE